MVFLPSPSLIRHLKEKDSWEGQNTNFRGFLYLFSKIVVFLSPPFASVPAPELSLPPALQHKRFAGTFRWSCWGTSGGLCLFAGLSSLIAARQTDPADVCLQRISRCACHKLPSLVLYEFKHVFRKSSRN